MTSIYDPQRLDKIATIMPSFSEVAEVGDQVYFGLEGDPQFPAKYRNKRPSGVVAKKIFENDEYHVTFNMDSGEEQTVSQSVISPYNVWEYDDESFEKVMLRESDKAARAEKESLQLTKEDNYRGTSEEADQFRSEFETLKKDTALFQETVFETLKELANDIVTINNAVGGSTNRCEFSNIFRASKAEENIDPCMRGKKEKGSPSVVSAASSTSTVSMLDKYKTDKKKLNKKRQGKDLLPIQDTALFSESDDDSISEVV